MIKDYFHVPLSEDKQGRRYLELIYAGAVLKDNWIIADIGISVSSVIRCVVKEEDKPAFYVYNSVSQEKVPIMGSIHLLATKVSFLKTLVTLKCGFPNSVYCLRTPGGREMYDCNTLNDYHLDIALDICMEQFLKIREYLAAYITFAMLTLDLFLNTMDVTPKRKRHNTVSGCMGWMERISDWMSLRKQSYSPTSSIQRRASPQLSKESGSLHGSTFWPPWACNMDPAAGSET
ncbi:protein ANKUB1 isoform B [Alligator mississippiensis]|uniref:Protein ANKUB1 isoform B n=1 Tax=Alligator mississippiensis TaxID=8496 RepID=A0A151NAW0_ALLMI|nr:protein ANKUB1 isoform B [Alligator mississippiensis]